MATRSIKMLVWLVTMLCILKEGDWRLAWEHFSWLGILRMGELNCQNRTSSLTYFLFLF